MFHRHCAPSRRSIPLPLAALSIAVLLSVGLVSATSGWAAHASYAFTRTPLEASAPKTTAAGAYRAVLARLQHVSHMEVVEEDRYVKTTPNGRASAVRIAVHYRAPDWIERVWTGLNPVGHPVTVDRVQVGNTICQKTPDFNNGHWQRYNWPQLFRSGGRVDVTRTLFKAGISLPPPTPPHGLGQTISFRLRTAALPSGRRAPAIGVTLTGRNMGDGMPAPVTYRRRTYLPAGGQTEGLLVLNPSTGLPRTYTASIWALIASGRSMSAGPRVLTGEMHIAFTYGSSLQRLPRGGNPPC